MLKASQVGGFLISELWLYTIASHLLYVEGQKVLVEEVVGVVVHYPKGGYIIVHPPAGMDCSVGLQIVVVTLT